MRQLSREQIEKVIDCFKIKNIHKNEYAFEKDELCRNKIMFVIEGKHSLESESKIQLFGASALIHKGDIRFEKDCLFKTDGKIA